MIYRCKDLCKSYGTLPVLRQVSLSLVSGRCYGLMAPSGSGKTTLFRLLCGLETPDSGSLGDFSSARYSMVFQEDRLCSHLSPVVNVAMVMDRPDPAAARQALLELLPEHCLSQPVSSLSGGMKRRTAIVRAMIAESDIVLMDEPFNGLDEESRKIAVSYLKRHQNGRLILFSSHQREDLSRMGAEILSLTE